jgi:RsiW-degrading membrane proteinase PrsW (M82 family)
MTVILLLSGIIAPALLWIGYFYYKDRHQPEPVICTGTAFILGFLAAYLCFKSYGLLPSFGIPEDASVLMEHHGWLFLLYCLGPVGLMEEFIKFLPFIIVILRFKDFDEEIDGIVYASIIALGFASYENIHYLAELDGFALFGRAVASPLTHTIFSSIWGHMVGVAYMRKQSLIKASVKGLTLSAMFHGIFDFLTTSPTLRVASAAVILVIWLWRIHVMEKMVNDHINGKNGGEENDAPKNRELSTV